MGCGTIVSDEACFVFLSLPVESCVFSSTSGTIVENNIAIFRGSNTPGNLRFWSIGIHRVDKVDTNKSCLYLYMQRCIYKVMCGNTHQKIQMCEYHLHTKSFWFE